MEFLKSFELKNLTFIILDLDLAIKENAEDFVRTLFTSLGYKVKKQKNNGGIPDFRISNRKESFYVEVKGDGDGLRVNQVKWIRNNPNEQIIVFYLNQITTDKIISEEDLLKEKKALVIKLEDTLGKK